MRAERYHYAKRTQRDKKHGVRLMTLFVIMLSCFVLVGYITLRPITYAAQLAVAAPDTGSSPLSWPHVGAAGLRAESAGMAPSSSGDQVVPIASTTKLITALAILEKRPLRQGEQGEVIRFTEGDVAIYQRVIAQDGAGVPVAPGQTMTELQALQAMLLASANNIAITLVSWAFGSEQAYNAYANEMVHNMGCDHTHITGSGGLEADTVSSAADMTRVAARAASSPVLADITALQSVEIPGFGVIYNSSHITGLDPAIHPLKVGLTDEAGACFVYWLEVQTPAGVERVYGAVFGQPDFHKTLLTYVNALAQGGVRDALTSIAVAGKGDVIVSYVAAGKHLAASAAQDIRMTTWKGTNVIMHPSPASASPSLYVRVGSAEQTYPLTLNGSLNLAWTERMRALRL